MSLVSSRSLLPMDSAELESSSLAKLAYDNPRAILQVEFRDGAVYQYLGVPLHTYQDLLRAGSKGAYFNRHIRSRFSHAIVRAARSASSAPADALD
jgi:hypothetical protein